MRDNVSRALWGYLRNSFISFDVSSLPVMLTTTLTTTQKVHYVPLIGIIWAQT